MPIWESVISGVAGLGASIYSVEAAKGLQQKEFDQQVFLMDKENEYNLPTNQMQRLKDAGINPNTAAAGVAGNGNTSASPSSVPSATAAPAQAVTAGASAAGAVSNAMLQSSQRNEIETMLDVNKSNVEADTIAKLEAAGLSHESASAIVKTLPYQVGNMAMDIAQKRATIDKTNQEFQNLKAYHDNIVAEYNKILAETNLIQSQEQYQKALTDLTKEQYRYQNEMNEFWKLHGYMPDSPLDISLRNAIENGHDINAVLSSIEFYNDTLNESAAKSQITIEQAKNDFHKQTQKYLDDNKIQGENRAKIEQIIKQFEKDLDLQNDQQRFQLWTILGPSLVKAISEGVTTAVMMGA